MRVLSLDKVTQLALLERRPVAADLAAPAPQAVHALVKKVSRHRAQARAHVVAIMQTERRFDRARWRWPSNP